MLKPRDYIELQHAFGTALLHWKLFGALITRHDYSTEEFIHEVDGETITYFHLVAPERRQGSDPDRWVDTMRKVGLTPDHDDSTGSRPDFTFANMFALTSRITGVRFSQDMLALPFLGAATGMK